MDYFVLKENILLWCTQKSILPMKNIKWQIFLFDGLAWKHAFAQIVFTTVTICLNKKYFFYFVNGLENIIQCMLSVKLSAQQIFLFDCQALKHYSMEIIRYSNIYSLYKYHTLEWKNIFFMAWLENSLQFLLLDKPVWRSVLKTFPVNKNFRFFRCNLQHKKYYVKNDVIKKKH